MAGWDLKNGTITEYDVSEARIWSLFNVVLSDGCKKRNTYKFGLIKHCLIKHLVEKQNKLVSDIVMRNYLVALHTITEIWL